MNILERMIEYLCSDDFFDVIVVMVFAVVLINIVRVIIQA